ncbi:HEAT repeat domain-containing protein [Cellvibrio sp. OA-2007]|uniref:HEAT repeat domain-containing protein n=1 Tax=Cellvibrio sp. OA-2007 TaxID=529823 RepID=UPI0007829D31|nr:HEAT repeat domain-containing protein [Cellvibrio sp. OA-2007]
MANTPNFKQHFLLPAVIGAGLAYGAFIWSNDNTAQREQIAELENRIVDLELLLSQKEDELQDARFFAAGSLDSFEHTKPDANAATPAPSATQSLPEPAPNKTLVRESEADSQQLLRDLGTLSDRDPRSFSEKATALLAGNLNKDGIAIVSKSVFELADNREILPDYELESLYQNQSNPDLKRVIAQVMSTRGDSRLLEKQIARSQTNLSSDDPAVRQQALVELGKTRYASAANAIAPLLQDSNTNVKLDALLALKATGNQNHLRQVEALIDHPDPAVSWLAKEVASSLQNLSDKARTQLAGADIVAELPVIQ